MDVIEHSHCDEVVAVLNRKLMRAWLVLKDHTCTRCGIVHWHGRTTNNCVDYKIEADTCHSCVAQDEDQKKNKDKPGVTRYVVPVMVQMDGEEKQSLPSFADYQAELYEEYLRKQKITDKKEG